MPPPPSASARTARARKRDTILVALAHRIAAVIAVLALLISLGGLLPPWNTAMLAVHIAESECGVWLLAALVVAIALACLPTPSATTTRARRGWFTNLTIAVAIVTAIDLSLPFVQLGAATRDADRELATIYGSRWQSAIPAADLAAMRPSTFSIGAAFFGIPLSTTDPTPAITIRPFTVAGGDGAPLTGVVYTGDAAVTASAGLSPASATASTSAAAPGKPILIVIHGGGWHHGDVTEAADCNRYLAAHGWLVYSIAYRLAPTTHFPGQLDDVHSAIDGITAHAAADGGDPTRIILMGRSAGAELAQIAAFTAKPAAEKSTIKAVIAWYSPIDMVTAITNPSHPDPLDAAQLIEDYLGGTPDQFPDRYRDASPLSYAVSGTTIPPLLLISGHRDHAVLIQYQHLYHERQIAAGHPTALLEIPWAEHACDLVSDGPSAQFGLYYLERFAAWAIHRDDQPADNRWTRPR